MLTKAIDFRTHAGPVERRSVPRRKRGVRAVCQTNVGGKILPSRIRVARADCCVVFAAPGIYAAQGDYPTAGRMIVPLTGRRLDLFGRSASLHSQNTRAALSRNRSGAAAYRVEVALEPSTRIQRHDGNVGPRRATRILHQVPGQAPRDLVGVTRSSTPGCFVHPSLPVRA